MNKIAVVTGANSGIGFAVCKELLDCDFDIVGVGRSEKKCRVAESELSILFPNRRIVFLVADLMSQSQVRRLGEELTRYINENYNGRLDLLVNNAGGVSSSYKTTEDGIEQQFAINHLSSFLLTNILLSSLEKTHGRILFTSSDSHKWMWMNWSDLMFKRCYNTLLAYKQSKLCNVLFAYALNDRYSKRGITAYCVDPGLVCTDIGLKNTSGISNWWWKIRMNFGDKPEVPAKTYRYLAESVPAPIGLYFLNSKPIRYNSDVNKKYADRLFAISEEYCGVKYG